MIKFALIMLLALAGCCTHKEIKIIGSAENKVLIYDPNNDTIYWFSTKNWDVIKYPEWTHGQ